MHRDEILELSRPLVAADRIAGPVRAPAQLEVLADQARASTDRDLFVTGDAVNVAARLQSVAEPDAILVDPPRSPPPADAPTMGDS